MSKKIRIRPQKATPKPKPKPVDWNKIRDEAETIATMPLKELTAVLNGNYPEVPAIIKAIAKLAVRRARKQEGGGR